VLTLDRVAVRPGETIVARGDGCAPASRVEFSSDTEQLGATTADAAGAFVGRVRFASVADGRRVLTARCSLKLTADVDVVVDAASSSPLTPGLPLLAGVLLAAGAVGWQQRSLRGSAAPLTDVAEPVSAPPDEAPTGEAPAGEAPTGEAPTGEGGI
jgi:hypothetical protein